ncbi:unnamed protein product [Dovyalis caffra]|uniref:Uncharacterized protein n=1 Tax=Dovyalis caffra TaxID=77055 RepID=A0AAV1RMD3_9ROSI|nr:unnamed protein product [Dovyalis caffra]
MCDWDVKLVQHLMLSIWERIGIWEIRTGTLLKHERYVTQYRAIFVVNCKVDSNRVQHSRPNPKQSKRSREPDENEANPADGETFKAVCCSVCSTEVGVIDEDEVYHFVNVLPSES